MNKEPSNNNAEVQDQELQKQLDAAASNIERITIFLGFVHKEISISKEMLEKGMALCLANAAYIGAGKIALLLNKWWEAQRYFIQAFWHYQSRGYHEEALGIMRLMNEHNLLRDNQLRIEMFRALGLV